MSPTAELRRSILSLLAGLDPASLSGEAAAAVVRDLAAVEKAAATGRMFAAVRVAQTDAWRGQGHRSAVDWLAAQCGITVHEAGVQLGTAKQAEQLPKTKEEMRAGKLSPTQAAAVAEGASADPGAEADLLAAAERETTQKLRERAARVKAAATDSETRERRIHRERSVRMRTDADGAFCLSLRGPGADGIRFQALVKPFEEQAFRAARRAHRDSGELSSYENRTYDAFQALLAQLRRPGEPRAGEARPAAAPTDTNPSPTSTASSHVAAPARCSSVASGRHEPPTASTPAPGGSDAARGHGGDPPPRFLRPPGGDNVKVIVVIDHAALLRGRTIAGETCHVAGLGPISVTAVRDLLATDDPFVAAVVKKGRDVVNVAHLGRGLSRHQRTAVEAQDLRCSNRACNQMIALQIDHRLPWVHDRQTKLDNQDPLCPDCHRRKTHHGWHLEPGRGPRRFLPPDGDPAAGTDDPAARPRSGPRLRAPGRPAGPERSGKVSSAEAGDSAVRQASLL